MARKRKISVAAVNIAMGEPHSPQRYLQLIQALFDLRQPVRTRGDQFIIFASLDETDGDAVSGTLGRFTEIEADLPWFDLDRMDAAGPDTLQRLSIPPRLRPNYRPFFFWLDGLRHIMVFEQRGQQISVSPWQVLRAMSELTAQPSVVAEFGRIEISLIQAEEALEDILGLRHLRRLRITYTLPNPDDLASFEATMQRRLAAQGIQRMTLELEADLQLTLEPDEDTRRLARSALSNGEVEAAGVDGSGEPVLLRSNEHPRSTVETYDADAVSERHAFLKAARRFVGGEQEI